MEEFEDYSSRISENPSVVQAMCLGYHLNGGQDGDEGVPRSQKGVLAIQVILHSAWVDRSLGGFCMAFAIGVVCSL